MAIPPRPSDILSALDGTVKGVLSPLPGPAGAARCHITLAIRQTFPEEA